MKHRLAAIALQEARKNYHGDTTSIGNLHPLHAYFQDEIGLEELGRDWSGAFAYRCAVLAGSKLPARYPDTRVHAGFWSVRGWVEYAMLPKIHIWDPAPEQIGIGDLAVICMERERRMLIGIVVGISDETVELSVGDYHGHSAIVEFPIDDNLMGVIRLNK